jgi:hypothetical protein
MVLVKVKHGKAAYDIEFDTAQSVLAFKQTLQAVTNVPPERQTLMGKGLWIGTLKDDKDISGLAPKVGQVITLMGSADVLKEVPKDVSYGNGMFNEDEAGTHICILTIPYKIYHTHIQMYRRSSSLKT